MQCFAIHVLALLSPIYFFGQNTDFIRLDDLSPHFYYDIRYATDNNFVGEAVYDCGICLLRPEAAQALNEANEYFMSLGYCIQIYDCYRPYPVQKKLWEKVPNPAYVANPYDGGSIHNRGAAVDLTLVDFNGDPVDFGTDYDYFGREAHIDYMEHSSEVLSNRKLLSEGLAKFGFKGIRTEWWHFSYTKNSGYPISEQPLPCEE
ncbi:M15 family metallopeptidase [Gilvibacter sp.]|uniref:M15 family metallopeptidase n=1 Tax=Gilvibacter sp. TaxID=2729997 RepID=UPI003F4A2443